MTRTAGVTGRFVMAVSLAALGAGHVRAADPSPKEVARRAIEEVWNQGRFDGDPLLAPTLTLHYQLRAIPLTPESATAVVKRWRTAFPDFHFQIEEIVTEGDLVVMRVPFTGTQMGAFMGAEPTGKKVSVSETLMMRVVHGQITEMWEDYDEYGLRVQLGLIKTGGGTSQP
jgi:hypothetical protein